MALSQLRAVSDDLRLRCRVHNSMTDVSRSTLYEQLNIPNLHL